MTDDDVARVVDALTDVLEKRSTWRLAIIPARGGSKRLPRKNILPFLGRPIIAHTIEAATESRCFARILVSTEDAEIADAAAPPAPRYISATLRSPPMPRR